MSFGSSPTPPSPTQSASANALSNQAGTMFNMENAPTMAWEDAASQGLFQPYQQALQGALDARSSYNTAAANQAIQSATDPAAYQARQMAMQGANQKVAQLYGVSPSDYSFSSPGAFSTPALSSLPNLGEIGNLEASLSSLIRPVNIAKNEVLPAGPQGNPYYIQF